MLSKIKADPITFVLGFLTTVVVAAEKSAAWPTATTGGKLLILLESAVPVVFGYFTSDAK